MKPDTYSAHRRKSSDRVKGERVALSLWLSIMCSAIQSHAEGGVPAPLSSWTTVLQAFTEHLGALLIAIIAAVLAYVELKAHRRTAERRLEHEVEVAAKKLELEERRFQAEADERKKLQEFREEEYVRFSRPASELAENIAGLLVKHPDWAHRALEAAKLLPYTHTLFADRSQHFKQEKLELAARFTPYLLNRCEVLATEDRHVFLLIDAGTTLYPFFEIIGQQTMTRWQRGEDRLKRFHLATNNLPGIEKLIETGRRVPGDRYSKLAIEDCHLLPGIPVPVFAAVAGEETNEAIRRFREKYPHEIATFVALVVGNWVRLRRTEPRCPVPMARGIEHREVKQTLFDNADEVFVVSPLGKIFVEHSEDEINTALGFTRGLSSPMEIADPEKEPYSDVGIDNAQAQKVKLVATSRAKGCLLSRHSNRVEDALSAGIWDQFPSEEEFAHTPIEKVPHLLFPFGPMAKSESDERELEFPHYYTRQNQNILRMFSVDLKH
ncbi:MAG: hypothetical protein A2Y79_08825 [Deltaproteobacteria bacterium RBG_13_43_22]|nr:MAG: hypothetical protein A2Y79_08825 [Deltaproteobacteria bacterium RBG_13_43_22]